MTNFQAALDQIRRRSEATMSLQPLRLADGFACIPQATGGEGAGFAGGALSAYAECDEPALRPRRPLDLASIRAALASATGDATRLSALRRSIAREIHPDIGGDAALMTEINAAIDAALGQGRQRA